MNQQLDIALRVLLVSWNWLGDSSPVNTWVSSPQLQLDSDPTYSTESIAWTNPLEKSNTTMDDWFQIEVDLPTNFQEYGGFHKWGTPKIIHFSGISPYKPSILGYPIYGNPHMANWCPYECNQPPGCASRATRRKMSRAAGHLKIIRLCRSSSVRMLNQTEEQNEEDLPSKISNLKMVNFIPGFGMKLPCFLTHVPICFAKCL